MSVRATSRLRGLGYLFAIVAIVAGVPWLLLAIGASPVPSTWPSGTEIWRSLTTPDDGSAMLVAFRYAAWFAWLFFVVSLVVELVARVTGADVPEMRGLSLPQGAARALISGAAMLFITAPAVTAWAGAAHGATGSSSTDATATSSTAATGALGLSLVSDGSAQSESPTGAEDRAARDSERPAPTRDHVVQQGETLWSIAENHLGDGARYPEIVNLNPGTISSSHWISPGTTIQLPAESATTDTATTTLSDAASDTRTVEAGDTLWDIAEDELGDGSRYPEIVAATGTEEQPDGGRLTDPDLIHPGWQLQVPGSEVTEARADRDAAAELLENAPTVGQVARAQAGVDAAESAEVAAASSLGEAAAAAGDPASPLVAWGRTALGLGAVTAAGLLGLLEIARRRRARVLGRPGRSEPDPRELELGLVADGLTAATIDLALRHLVVAARQAGRGVPGLLSARMTREQLDVHLTSPMRLPAPWTSTADPRVWTLAADRAVSLDAAALAETPPPFPGLVSIGQDDEEAHVLVNLVETRTFTVAGQNVHTRSALAAMALDLASSPWAGSTLVTVVGGHASLQEAIRSPRVRFVASPADYALSATVTSDPDVREVIVASGDLDGAGAKHLENAVASSPRVALVRAGTTADDGAHALTISSDPDVAVLSPAYLQLRPQRLDPEDLAAIGELFALAAASTDQWAPPAGEPTLARVGAAAAAMGAPGIVVDADPDHLPADDAPTQRRAELDVAAHDTTPGPLWNTPVTTPQADAPRVPGDDVPTQRRSRHLGVGDTADAGTPGWLSNQITPTPGTPLPPVIAFPQHVRELAPPVDAPVLRVLGPVDIDNVGDDVDPVHRTRLTELAAYVGLHPEARAADIDDAMWPNRSRHDHAAVRTSSLAAVGDWLAGDADADAGRQAAEALTCDWHLWRRLLPEGRIEGASTAHLEQALGLVRGRPFSGVHPRHYLWALELRSTMIHEITLAAAELARRRLMERAWSTAYDATVVGLTVEPSVEALWRMQLLSAHEMGDRSLVEGAMVGLHDLSSTLADPLEDQTLLLLQQVEQVGGGPEPAQQTTHHAV